MSLGGAVRIVKMLERLVERHSARAVIATVIRQSGPARYTVNCRGRTFDVQAAYGVSVRAGQSVAVLVQREAGIILLGAVNPLAR